MESYSPSKFEKKWQKIWQDLNLYQAADPTPSDPASGERPQGKMRDLPKPKFYALVEFPYPSGERLHVGHARSYSALDTLARYKRMKGFNVLFPMGWDAFGLPAENYAIKTGIHPSLTTKENIAKAKAQALSWGLSFDWSREINTTDPNYYRWTQWIFLQLLKKGLTYRAEINVNWCPSCKINLANEEVIEGNCERCGTPTEKRRQKQWMLAITKYANRLLEDLKSVDYEPRIKKQQVEWIGRKKGINIKFKIDNSQLTIKDIDVFTTRPDTMFGATFIVLAPEHDLVKKIVTDEQRSAVEVYLKEVQGKSELERIAEGRKKTGVFTGCYAINELNGYQMPIWISDFVLSGFGTGALVGVPGHDKRDFEFAKEFGLAVKRVIVGSDGDSAEITRLEQVQEESGTMVNSGFLEGLSVKEAIDKMMEFLEEKGWGQRTVSYHLRDWVFSRQHYWGEPIPVVYCPSCAKLIKNEELRIKKKTDPNLSIFNYQLSIENGIEYAIVPVPEDELPVELPFVENYKPAQSGESPLSAMKDWVMVACPGCGSAARRETDTMPNWAGSSWYYLAYLMADKIRDWKLEIGNCKFQNIFEAGQNILAYWLPVDWYNGGMEHTTLHLLYSRFWHKFLYDLGLVPTSEPYAKRTSHGVVLGPDGSKMSKSKGNVINPDEIVAQFGADSLRMYEMFMGPFAQEVAWNMNGVAGVYRFLGRVWTLFANTDFSSQTPTDTNKVIESGLGRLTRKVSSDIQNLKFNTAIAAMMKFLNEMSNPPAGEAGVKGQMSKADWDVFLRLLAPFAPHLAEELWQRMHNAQPASSADGLTMDNAENNSQFSIVSSQFRSIHQQLWPELEVEEDGSEVEIVVQIDGKFRDTIKIQKSKISSKGGSASGGKNQKEVEKLALSSAKIQSHLAGKNYKVIFVAGRVINFVTVRDQIPDLTS